MYGAVAGAIETIRVHVEGIPGFQIVASAPYLFRPFFMLMILAIATAVVGVLINLRQAEFSAETMVHAVFPGIVVGAVFGGLNAILPSALIAALLTAAMLTWLTGRPDRVNHHADTEASSAIVLSSFYALGIVVSLHHGDKSGQLEALMFGRLLELSVPRLVDASILCLIGVCILMATWNRQVAVAFDRLGARASGVRVWLIDAIFNASIALIVCAASSAVGVLLAVGLLIVPGLSARITARSAHQMVPLALCFAVLSTYLGVHLPFVFPTHPVSPQACVALSVCGCFFVLLVVTRLPTWLSSRWRSWPRILRMSRMSRMASSKRTVPCTKS